MVCRKLVSLAAVLASYYCTGLAAQALPEQGADLHRGVASCATSVCHGKVSPDTESTVWLNEYRVWLREDFHSRAYRTLQTAQSKTIARKLGLPSAHAAKICLDCHTDNVPVAARGRRFQISDGVGCEACHGGSERWLESHAETTTSHADNTHQIMGAGHPRLSFELETFTVNQPAHYEVDADYSQRKPSISSVNMWLSGLAVMSLQTLELLQQPWFTKETLVPELAFYQCHACHHPMDDLRWQAEGGNSALPPGMARLNDGSLQVLLAVLEQTAPQQAGKLAQGIDSLHSASLSDRTAVVAAAQNLHAVIMPLVEDLSAADYSPEKMRALRKGLLSQAASGRFRHFTAAEQIFLAVETLCLSLSEVDKYEVQLDKWFKTMDNENTFVPAQYAVFARQLLDVL